jgi:hypothetical protein
MLSGLLRAIFTWRPGWGGFMAYVRAWQRLSDAIESVTAAAGRSREEAKADICQAIADRTVKIQGKPKRHTIRPVTSARVLEGKDFEIPAEIKPTDLDWEKSRPVNPWAVPREVFGFPGYWELEWIELFSADVMNILCTPAEPGGPAERPSNKSRSRPSSERAQQAIHELYPHGVPSPADLPNSLLCRQVGEKLKERGLPHVSDDTILRVAGRRK